MQGFAGLNTQQSELPCSPCVEIGWRLSRAAWGHGFATEAARGALRFGFERLDLAEIVAVTAFGNVRSVAVMERLGMHGDGLFELSGVAEGDALRSHRLYRMTQPEWPVVCMP